MGPLASSFRRLAPAVIFWFFLQTAASATTYYIDYAAGSNANNGTSKTTPWQHMPGMQGCTASCASAVPKSGDRIILKGGVTWPNAAFPVIWAWSGSSGSPIYIGVDQTWYAGAAWVRPVFDAGGVAISGSYNAFAVLIGQTYITLDNLEMRNAYWSGTPVYGHAGYVICSGSDYLILDHLFLHQWYHAAGASDNVWAAVHGDTNQPVMQHSWFQNGVIENADGNNDLGDALWAWGNVTNSVIHDVTNAILLQVGGSKEISGNLIYNINQSSAGTHENAIETIGAGATGTFYIHDNVIRDMQVGESLMVGNPNETVYAWNNVIYNLLGVGANPPHFPQSAGTGGLSANFWNNTIVPLAGNACFIQNGNVPETNLAIQNNHCVSTTTLTQSITTSSPVIDHNVLQTPANSAQQGFTSSETYAYSPSASTSGTVSAGTNLGSSCSGILAGMCSDTNYACTEGPVGQVSCPARPRVSRSSSWDAGAYMFSSGTTAVSPPTGLQAVVQ